MRSGRDPAVAFAEDADEERAAAIDLGEADGQDVAALGLLLGDAPAQIDLAPGDAALFAELAELGEDPFDQLLAFGEQVAERGRHKDADNPLANDQCCVHRLTRHLDRVLILVRRPFGPRSP